MVLPSPWFRSAGASDCPPGSGGVAGGRRGAETKAAAVSARAGQRGQCERKGRERDARQASTGGEAEEEREGRTTRGTTKETHASERNRTARRTGALRHLLTNLPSSVPHRTVVAISGHSHSAQLGSDGIKSLISSDHRFFERPGLSANWQVIGIHWNFLTRCCIGMLLKWS